MGVIFDGIISAFRLILTFDREVLEITFLSLRVSLVAVLIGALIAVPIAAVISFNRVWGKRILINLIHTLMGLPPVVVGLFVYIVLSRQGVLGFMNLLYNPTAMILAQMVMVIPIITGITITAINAVDKSKKEAIITLGATKLQLIAKVIKEARHTIITGLITAFGAAISEVGAIMIVGGNIRYHTRALTTAIVLETRRGNFDLAIALGIILIVLAFIINFVLTHFQQKSTVELLYNRKRWKASSV